LSSEQWDGVVWYAQSIFHGPLASALKKSSGCKGYLIIRDIFTEWAVDMGLMGRGLPYRFFDAVARYQYSVADVINEQAPGNRAYFYRLQQQPGRTLKVLQNWLANVLFYDEIQPDEIPDLYAQCSAGIVVLDPSHKSHNFPGKF
jgi:hypothetical protein